MTTRPTFASYARSLRRTAPRCRGGASSLLRLSQPVRSPFAAPSLSSAVGFGGWVDRPDSADVLVVSAAR